MRPPVLLLIQAKIQAATQTDAQEGRAAIGAAARPATQPGHRGTKQPEQARDLIAREFKPGTPGMVDRMAAEGRIRGL